MMMHTAPRVLVTTCRGEDLEGLAYPCSLSEPLDLDGEFVVKTDEGTRYRVMGWACNIDLLEG